MTSPRDEGRFGADELAWREPVHDELRALRRRTAPVSAVAAVVAAGLAIWALVASGDDGSGPGAALAVRRGRVAALAEQLDDLRAALERSPASSAVTSLRARQRALERQLDALSEGIEQVGRTAAGLRCSSGASRSSSGAAPRPRRPSRRRPRASTPRLSATRPARDRRVPGRADAPSVTRGSAARVRTSIRRATRR